MAAKKLIFVQFYSKNSFFVTIFQAEFIKAENIIIYNIDKPEWIICKHSESSVWYVICLKPATLLKLTLLHGCFSRFWNCANGTKSRNASHIIYKISKTLLTYIFWSSFPQWVSPGMKKILFICLFCYGIKHICILVQVLKRSPWSVMVSD